MKKKQWFFLRKLSDERLSMIYQPMTWRQGWGLVKEDVRIK